MCVWPEITSFHDISSLDKYRTAWPKASGFIRKTITEFSPDMVIVVERKGRRLFSDLVDKRFIEENGFSIKTDSEFFPKDVHEKTVIIFDDSMRYAESVSKVIKNMGTASPKNVIVSALLSNSVAHKNLRDIGIDDDHIRSMLFFETYEEQQVKYAEFMFSLVHGVNNKLGTNYPTLTVESRSSVREISELLRSVFKNRGYVVDSSDNEINDYKGNIDFTAYRDEKGPISFDGFDYEEMKVRFCIFSKGEGSQIVMEAIQFPIELDRMIASCKESAMYNRLCDLMDIAPCDDICRKCMTLDISFQHLVDIGKSVLSDIGVGNAGITDVKVSLPSKERYPSEIIREWDIFQKLNE